MTRFQWISNSVEKEAARLRPGALSNCRIRDETLSLYMQATAISTLSSTYASSCPYPHTPTHLHTPLHTHHPTILTHPHIPTHTHTYPIIVLTRSPLQAHNVVGGDDKIVTCQTAQRKILEDIMATCHHLLYIKVSVLPCGSLAPNKKFKR